MDKETRDRTRQYLADAAGYAKDAKNLLRYKAPDVKEVVRKVGAARAMLDQAQKELDLVS